jgi:hypothetical protein
MLEILLETFTHFSLLERRLLGKFLLNLIHVRDYGFMYTFEQFHHEK